jgi:phosphonate transport system substrate-binding protein
MHGDTDPFAASEADIGFRCSPSYLYLSTQVPPSVELVPAGFVFRDPRHAGQPVYYSEIVVRAQHSARAFADLAGTVWGFNDECSLSGYFSTLQELARLGAERSFFERWVRTGSHAASIEATLAGTVDGATIDSIAFALMLRERPELRERLRVLASFGPFPIQPVVVRSELAPRLRVRLADALLELGRGPGASLSRFGLEGCVPIDHAMYEDEHRALCSLGCLPR